ncbi:hypothetical protein BDF19DRAFT_450406 [Syncephalis fuscata]|nr:hypothetical protein BDF19DRAFT_450406 [Syncephalis fuscata]
MSVTNLSNKQIHNVQNQFAFRDTSGNGKISFNDLMNLYGDMNLLIDEDELQQLLGANAQRSTQFDIDTVLSVYAKLYELTRKRQDEKEKQLRHVFTLFDRDHDGKVTAEELQMIMTEVTKQPFSVDDAAQIVQILDTNGDGLVDADEIMALVVSDCAILLFDI